MTDYRDVIKGDQSLKLFLAKVADFDHMFSHEMTKGADFTIRLEVRGCKHKLVHVRVYRDSIDRPPEKDRDGTSAK